MNIITPLIIFAIGAYGLQLVLGLLQVKHFNVVYKELRSKGKIAIGRRPGKFRAGTLVFFGVKEEGEIFDARIMQGVTVLSKFRRADQYIGHDIHYIDKYHPLVQKENKLTQEAMEDARSVYLQVSVGNFKEEPAPTPFQQVGMHVNQAKYLLKDKIKGSV